MTEREKNQLKYSADYWLTECELPISKNYEVEYTQEQLDKELELLKEEGYNNEEAEYFKSCVENFSEEREKEIYDWIPYEDCNGGIDRYEENYRVETVTLTSKKIA